MPLPLLPGGPEEHLQPLLQDAVRDCYDEPCHWLQGALPRPHLGPQTDNSIQFNSIQFNSIQFNSIQFNSIQFNSIQFNSIQLDVRYGLCYMHVS